MIVGKRILDGNEIKFFGEGVFIKVFEFYTIKQNDERLEELVKKQKERQIQTLKEEREKIKFYTKIDSNGKKSFGFWVEDKYGEIEYSIGENFEELIDFWQLDSKEDILKEYEVYEGVPKKYEEKLWEVLDKVIGHYTRAEIYIEEDKIEDFGEVYDVDISED